MIDENSKNDTEELRREYNETIKKNLCRRGSCEIGEIRKKFPRKRFSMVKEKLIFL
jgi:hypothetical protein